MFHRIVPRRPKKTYKFLHQMLEKGESIKNTDIPNKTKITKQEIKATSNICVFCGDTTNSSASCENEEPQAARGRSMFHRIVSQV